MDPLAWDRETARFVVEHRVALLDPVARGLSQVGRASLVWLVLALVFAFARRRPALFMLVAAAAALSDLLTRVLKHVVGRPRPDLAVLLPQPDSSSFPSGHAASSFACAVVLGALLPAWRVPLYLLAALIAGSRVYVGAHYPLDILGGALCGVASGLAVLAAARFDSAKGGPIPPSK